MAPSRPEGGGEAYGLQAAATPRDRSGRGRGQRAAPPACTPGSAPASALRGGGSSAAAAVPAASSSVMPVSCRAVPAPRRPAASGLRLGCTAFWPEVPLEGLRPWLELSPLFSPLPTQPPASATLPKIGSQGSFIWQSGFRTSKLQGLQAITSLKLPCKEGETETQRGAESRWRSHRESVAIRNWDG